MENKIAEFLFNRAGVGNFRKFLNVASFRHKLIGGNIANSSTPGYEAKDIDFNKEYNKLIKNSGSLSGALTHESHIPTGSHESRPPKVNEARVTDGDMNSVNIDKEIPNLAQNELVFTVGATLLQRRFEEIRKVIQSK